jgi:integrase
VEKENLEKYEKQESILGQRNSYSKTDNDQALNCSGCPLIEKCTKGNGNRTVSVNPNLEKHKEIARKNLSSEKGKVLRKRRAPEIETFFNGKQFIMQQEISKLIDDCLLFFSGNCYSQNRIDKYRSLWKYGILRYMKEKDLSLYAPSLGQEYITDCIPCDNLRHDDREKIRSIQVLDDYLNLGHIRKRTVLPVQHPLDGEIGLQMQKLIDHLQSLRRSSVTIKDYELYLNRFLFYPNQSEVYTMKEIRERHIMAFLSTTENNKINVASSLRVLFRFWSENHMTDENFEDVLEYYKWVKQEKIPSFFSADEICTIEESVDRSGGIGKRNYAMLLLASRLGLCASDIANLQFSNIDWENSEIRLTQYKTGNPIIESTPYTIKLFGKGRKSRVVPLMAEQIVTLKRYM